MKRVLLFGITFLLLAGLFPTSAQNDLEKPPFKMIIRLWPDHHKVDSLSAQLIQALRQYPHFCDEVWLCAEIPMTLPLEEHLASAYKMAKLAKDMRKLGVVPSIQCITVGHPEDGSAKPDPNIHWGTMVGPDGAKATTQSCPRQPGFLQQCEDALAIYAKAVQPNIVWLDDDLRITSHVPASAICYCDDCIRQFNELYGYSYNRVSLVDGLAHNQSSGELRKNWIRFCQDGLACVASATARGVHNASPKSRMGLQHVGFHQFFLEGYDWNPIFNAFERETGLTPASRPGHGNYNDHAPRSMFEKGLQIARQIRRLNKNIVEIAPEIEGYLHKSTGKSAHGVCIETMYYLSMGATQMSYALICSAQEPMQWYADHYFKHLQLWHEFAREYADFNWGTEPGGINPYISPNMPYVNESPSAQPFAWATTTAGNEASSMVPLGIPFCPDGNYPVALMLDEASMSGITDEEMRNLLQTQNLILDASGWNALQQRGLTSDARRIYPRGLQNTPCYELPMGHRITVVSFSPDINGDERLLLLRAMDWASYHRLPAIIESRAQAALVPRVDAEGNLRSVAILNSSITPEDSYTLRLRPGRQNAKRFIWKKNGEKDKRLKPQYVGNDVLLTVPALEGWNFGWIAIE